MIPSFDEARELLAEFDGMPTELFVVGLAFADLENVLALLSGLPDIAVLSMDEDVTGEPERVDDEWIGRYKCAPSIDSQWAFISGEGGDEHLQLYFWFDADSERLEIEMVFWNDLTFAPSVGSGELERRWQRLAGLAESLRQLSSGTACVLSGEHNRTTEELFEPDSGALVW